MNLDVTIYKVLLPIDCGSFSAIVERDLCSSCFEMDKKNALEKYMATGSTGHKILARQRPICYACGKRSVPAEAHAKVPGEERISAVNYPRLAAYLARAGSDPWPEDQTKTDVTLGWREEANDCFAEASLPSKILRRLSDNWKPFTWMPCANTVMLALLMRDRKFKTDREHHQYIFDTSSATFQSFLYRAMVRLGTPSLLVLATRKTWGFFYRGSQLENVSRRPTGTTLKLTFHEWLFDHYWLDLLGTSIIAALVASGAKNARSHVHDVGATSALIDLDWE